MTVSDLTWRILNDPAHEYHGTTNAYNNHGCRCEACKAANTEANAEAKARRFSEPTPDHVHGSENGYGNYGCRCDACTAAWSLASNGRARKRRARIKDARIKAEAH